MCELERVDVLHETSLLSQYMVSPREGHLQQALNVFKYIKHNVSAGWLIFDPLDYEINWVPIRSDELHPKERDQAMKYLYPDAKNSLSLNMPEPKGNSCEY